MQKVRISNFQAATLFGNLVFGKAIGYSSGVMARLVGRDAWIAMLLAFVAGMPIMAAMVWLARRFNGETFEQHVPRLVGRPLGAVAMLLLAAFFFGAFMTSAITIEQHINDYLMTETPLLVFVILYTLVCIYGAYLGLEVIARLSVLGLLLTALLDFLMVIGSVDHLDLRRLLPVMENGPGPVALASLVAQTDVAMATAAAVLLLPLTAKSGRWMRSSLWGLAVGGLITAVWTVFEVGVLSPEVTAQYLIACMQMARAAELGIYLHRYEMLMVILFVYGVFTQSMVCLYGACELTAAGMPWLRRLGRGWVVTALGLLTILPQYHLAFDRDWYGRFLTYLWPAMALPVAFGIPLALAVVSLFRGRMTPGQGRP